MGEAKEIQDVGVSEDPIGRERVLDPERVELGVDDGFGGPLAPDTILRPMPRRPAVSATLVVAAVLVQQGRVLAARRGPGQRQAGLWEFPGGKVERGEVEPRAVVRELGEELGVVVRPLRRVSYSAWAYGSRRIVLRAWICRHVAGDLSPTEHSALAWVGPAYLYGLHWAPADVPLLPQIRAYLLDQRRRGGGPRRARRRRALVLPRRGSPPT